MPTKPLVLTLLAAALIAPGVARAGEDHLGGGPYGGLSKRATEGPHLTVVAATHFGGAGYEEFLGGGELADGTVVGIGNAWGPEFPQRMPVNVLGSGRHSGQVATITDEKAKKVSPDPRSTDQAGMVVLYGTVGGALKATKAIRFGWGVASITAGIVAGDGTGIIVGGRCFAGFASLAGKPKRSKTVAWKQPEGKGKGPGGDVYLARLSPAGQIDWLVLFEKNGDPPERIFSDDQGNVYCDMRGLQKIAADGSAVDLLVGASAGGEARWLGIDPRDGSSFFGGDRNTHTGREPYRQPYCYKYDPTGKKVQTLWEPVPKDIGADGAYLQSDSSIRAMAVDQDGFLVFAGWSDGGNSVLGRQPLDFRNGIPGKGMGISTAGMGVGSVSHLMRIDAKTFEGRQHCIWMAILPNYFGGPGQKGRGKPNGAAVNQLAVLAGGEVVAIGAAATGMIQTPNAFWKDPMLPDKHGGPTVTVFRPDLSGLMFSSYLPGIDAPVAAPTRKGLLVVGRSHGSDGWVQPTESPSVKADQPFAGGTDGSLIYLGGR
jgi:hypothetical protein